MKKILFYIHADWALGAIHFELAKYLHDRGIVSEVIDWSRNYSGQEIAMLAEYYEHVVTLPGSTWKLTDNYNVAPEKIIVVAHGKYDLQRALQNRPPGEFDRFAGFAVVSEFLFQAAMELGIRRIPKLVRIGVNFQRFRTPVSQELKIVGYGSIMQRVDDAVMPGVDIKRGSLAQEVTEQSGLVFQPAGGFTYLAMPQYYRQVDAVLVASLIEGSPLPPMEAAAAGRLVISTPAGHVPYLASLGAAIIAPTEASAYKQFAVAKLRYFKEHPAEYVETCTAIQRAAAQLDWQYFVDDWIDLFEGR